MRKVCAVLCALFVLGSTLGASQEIVAKHRAAFPTPMSEAQKVTLLRLVVAELGPPYGLLVKTAGNHCHGYACDIVCAGQGSDQRQWDILGDEDGAATPQWNAVPQIAIRPCEVPTVGTPVPDPGTDLVQRVEALEAYVNALQAWSTGVQAWQAAIADWQAEVIRQLTLQNEALAAAEGRIPSRCRVPLLGCRLEP